MLESKFATVAKIPFDLPSLSLSAVESLELASTDVHKLLSLRLKSNYQNCQWQLKAGRRMTAVAEKIWLGLKCFAGLLRTDRKTILISKECTPQRCILLAHTMRTSSFHLRILQAASAPSLEGTLGPPVSWQEGARAQLSMEEEACPREYIHHHAL